MRAGRPRSQRNGATCLEISTETVNKLWIKHDHVRPSSSRTTAFSVLHSRAAFTETGVCFSVRSNACCSPMKNRISILFTPGFNRLASEQHGFPQPFQRFCVRKICERSRAKSLKRLIRKLYCPHPAEAVGE